MTWWAWALVVLFGWVAVDAVAVLVLVVGVWLATLTDRERRP